jgi:hypothetical protein
MWAQVASAAVGIWFMAAPAVLEYTGVADTAHRIAGPIAATIALIAAFECTREVRLANVPVGVVLILAPLVVHFPGHAAFNSMAGGAAIAGFSCVRGRVQSSVGGGWRVLWRGTQYIGERGGAPEELKYDSIDETT